MSTYGVAIGGPGCVVGLKEAKAAQATDSLLDARAGEPGEAAEGSVGRVTEPRSIVAVPKHGETHQLFRWGYRLFPHPVRQFGVV